MSYVGSGGDGEAETGTNGLVEMAGSYHEVHEGAEGTHAACTRRGRGYGVCGVLREWRVARVACVVVAMGKQRSAHMVSLKLLAPIMEFTKLQKVPTQPVREGAWLSRVARVACVVVTMGKQIPTHMDSLKCMSPIMEFTKWQNVPTQSVRKGRIRAWRG